MVWLLLTALILLAQQFYFLRQDYRDDLKFEKRVHTTECDLLKSRIVRARQERNEAEELAEIRYTALKKWRRRYKSAVRQAKIWSQRAISLGFSRREHKDALRHARQLRKQSKLYLVPPTDNNQT